MISQIVQKLRQYRALTIIACAVLFVASIILIGKSTFSNNILDMLPVEDKILSRHVRFLSLFGITDRIVFEISIEDSSKTYNQLAATTRAVINQLRENDRLQFQQEITIKDFLVLRNFIIRRWPNLFTQKDSVWVSERLNNDSLSTRLDRTISELFTLSPEASDAFLLKNDPFGLARFSLAKLSAFKPAENITIEEGFITDKDRNRILFFADLKNSETDEDSDRITESVIKKAINYADENGFKLTWMGGLRASRDNSEIIKRDIHLTLPIAIIIILIICLLVYKKPYFGLLTFIPTVLGIAIMLAVFSHFYRLSIIIIGFSAALLGITVDYAIHYLYQVDDAPLDRDPVKTLAGPIFASAFTTAGAFFILVIAKIPGLSQLGIVTAIGIIIVALFSLTLLPLFYKPSNANLSKKPKIKLTAFFTQFYARGFDGKLIILIVLVTGISCFLLSKLSFDGDPDNLNGMKPETIAAEKSLARNWSGVESGVYFTVSDSSCEAVCRRVRQQLEPLIDTLTSLKLVKPAGLFTALLPVEEIQKQNRKRWHQTFTHDKIMLMHKVVQLIASRYTIEASGFGQYLSNIASYDSLKSIKYESVPLSFRKGLLRNYLRNDDSLWYGNAPVFLSSKAVWKDIDEIAKNHGVLAVNSEILGLRVIDIIKTGFLKCLIFIPFVILCILFVMLRSIRYTLVAILPVFAATIVTLGIMVVCKISINIVSLMIFAFVFGLGIDYSLLMVYMGRKSLIENEEYIPHGAASITVAACTTITGLGVLAIAKHPVLSVLGKTGMIGIVSSYVCAVIVVPVVLRLVNKYYPVRGG